MRLSLARLSRTLTLSSLIALAATPTQAQDYMASFSNGNLSADIANNILHHGLLNSRLNASAAGDAPAPAYPTRYQSDPAVTKRVKQQFADFVQSTGGDGAGIRAAMEQQDFLGRWGSHVAAYGLQRGDVADALTAYWVLNWQIANDVRSVQRAQVQAALQQVRRSLGGHDVFGSLNQAQKQEMAEVLILNFIAQSIAYEDAMRANDSALQGRLQDAAVARFQNEMQVNLRTLQLGTQGFQAKQP
ncbi:MAG TPA: hypothetical protein PLG97_08220 [Alcaligenes sp.]|nr:hypothetical protein [Alcaligenes sp.]HRL27489.1 hypothetical protein [Alcaligenes sp.]